MRKRDRGQSRSSWRFVADLLTGRIERRLLALEAETQTLAEKVAELEQIVARQDERLKALSDAVPRVMMRHDVDADTPQQPVPDRRKMH